MLKPFVLLLIPILTLCLIINTGIKQSYAERYEITRNFSALYLESYLDSVLSGTSKIDSVNYHLHWLQQNKNKLLSAKHPFSNAWFYIESARTNHLMDITVKAYKNIDYALRYLSYNDFPSLHFKTLKLGQIISSKQGDYATTINYLKKMHESGFLPNSSKQSIDILLDIARYYWNMHQYDKSMDYCQKALSLLQQVDYKEGKIENYLLMYHNSHFSMEDSSWSDYLNSALKIAKEIGDSAQLSKVYYNIGYSYYRENKHLKALENYKLSRLLEQNKGSSTELTTTIMQQLSYTHLDSIEAVNKTSNYIINQANKHKYYNVLGNAYRGRAWYFAKAGVKDSAIIYLNKAHEHRQSLNEKSKASPGFYYHLYIVAMLIPDYPLALQFLNISSNQVRQISRETNTKQLSQSRAEIDYELQRERIERLTLENVLEKEKRHRQQIISGSIFLVLILGISFLLFALKKYKELELSFSALVRKNKELDNLNKRLSQTEKQLNKTIKTNCTSLKDEENIYLELKALFEEELIFKRHDLSLGQLSKLLHTNTSYLSFTINNRFGVSFKTLLNQYRINAARKLLESEDYSNYTIEGIAEKVGYNSRSTFYQAFKEITGLTPTQYTNNLTIKKITTPYIISNLII